MLFFIPRYCETIQKENAGPDIHEPSREAMAGGKEKEKLLVPVEGWLLPLSSLEEWKIAGSLL
jgi:hypothetical protein